MNQPCGLTPACGSPVLSLARVHQALRCKLTDVETVSIAFTIIAAAIALAAQRRADMKLMSRRFDDLIRHFDKRFDDVNKRFDDVNRRIDDVNKRIDNVNKRVATLESQQREYSAALAAMGREVAKLAGRVDEVAGMVSSAFQAVFGVVMTRRDRKDRGSSVVEQAPFRESGSDED